uniref:non-specific serine/threonine protein kinase n=1 Tax=Eptatretus burgeri TaxID=7764 RepID=A0A8C4WTV9_EPTBU
SVALSLSLSLSRCVSRSLAVSVALSLSRSLAVSVALSLSRCLSVPLSLSRSLAVSLSLSQLNVKSLQHPNLVTLLAAWMHKLFVQNSCLEVGRGLAAGLSYLHSQGIVHLDVRPANAIMVDNGVKLCDFGCSQRLEPPSYKGRGPLTGAGGGGAYTHRAPELLRGERASASNDIYSLAVTLWQMWARFSPVTGFWRCSGRSRLNCPVGERLLLVKSGRSHTIGREFVTTCLPRVIKALNRCLPFWADHDWHQPCS